MSDEKPKPKPKQHQPSIDDQIKAIKNGDKYRHFDHVADWYSEKCTDERVYERQKHDN